MVWSCVRTLNLMTARGRRHLEEVDDERASIAQVVHHLVVIDVVVH